MKVGIIGAGGQARTSISLLELNNYLIEGVFDDNFDAAVKVELVDGYPLLDKIDTIPNELQLVLAKGSIQPRIRLLEQFKNQYLKDNLIHPKAVIDSSNLGESNQISALVFIAKTAQIGNHNIIYSQSSLEHETIIGDNNIVTVNVTLCGRVKIGNNCFLGASCTVLPNLSVCDNVTIGAGAVVTKSIEIPGTYIGTPAVKIY